METTNQQHEVAGYSINFSEQIKLVKAIFDCFEEQEIFILIQYANFRHTTLAYHLELMKQIA